jgi:quinolinate synthase
LSDNTIDEINRLKKQKNAVILAHNYQMGDIQDIADFVGDSLELSQEAAKTKADVIVFCGVDFMAETASILCPDKTVLLPEIHANCPMAGMVTTEKLRKRKAEMPNAAVVCYVNTSAEVKAESDICCTSGNAVKVVNSLPQDEILFVPDQYLGHFVSTQVKNKKFTLWPGYCVTHNRILPQHIFDARKEHPKATVVVHPECRVEVQEMADEVLSTGGMIRYARRPDVSELILGTELGILHRLRQEHPNKKFYPATEQAVCPRMKLTTMDSVLEALQEMRYVIKVPEAVRIKAWAAVDRMLKVS